MGFSIPQIYQAPIKHFIPARIKQSLLLINTNLNRGFIPLWWMKIFKKLNRRFCEIWTTH